MKRIELARIVLVLLMIAGGMSLSAAALGGGNPPGLEAIGQALGVPAWQQVNSNGFGDLDAGEVSALGAFGSYLYAGTSNPVDGARIFRSPDGTTWDPVTEPGFGITHDIRPPAILDLMVFNGRLYASTGHGDGPGQIWRTVNGTTWAPMVIHGFNDPNTVDITSLAVYGGWIYAGATNLISGVQIWRSFSGDGNIGSWTKVGPGVPGPAGNRITGFAEFGSYLYAAVESAGPAQVWRSSSGTSWTAVVGNGFGNGLTKSTGGLAVFNGYLYAGVGNETNGAQLWKTNNGTSWVQVANPGFGGTNNQKIESVFVFGNQLYASVKNASTGIELWRSPDGASWERANQDGFGDSHNTGTNWGNATTNFLSRLYVGTANALDGGELWRMQQQPPPPPKTSTPTRTPTQTPTPTPTPTPPYVSIPVYVPLILH